LVADPVPTTNGDGDGDIYTQCDAAAFGYPHALEHTDANQHVYTDGYRVRDVDTFADNHAIIYGDSIVDALGYPDTDSYPDTHADVYAQPDHDADQYFSAIADTD